MKNVKNMNDIQKKNEIYKKRMDKFKDEFKEISHEELMKSEIYFEYFNDNLFDDYLDLCVEDLHVLEKYLKDVLLYSNKRINETVICVSIINTNNNLTRFERDITIKEARKYIRQFRFIKRNK